MRVDKALVISHITIISGALNKLFPLGAELEQWFTIFREKIGQYLNEKLSNLDL